MERKLINKEIRRLSNSSSLPVLLYIILTIIIPLGINTLFGVLNKAFIGNLIFKDTGFYYLVVYVAVYLILIPLLLLLFYKTRGKKTGLTLKSGFVKPQKSAGWCAKWILIALGVAYLSSILSNLIFTAIQILTGVELHAPDMTFGNSVFGILTTILAVPIFAPIFEELMFRATIYRNNEPMGQWFAIIVSGITFGLWHTNYQQFIYAAVIGMFSCFILAKTRSIIPSIIIHFIFNLIGTVQSLCITCVGANLTEADMEYNIHYIFTKHIGIGIILVLMFLIIAALIVIGMVLFIIQIVKHDGWAGLSRGAFDIRNSKKFAVYFSAPITIITFLLMIAGTVYAAIFI